MKPCKSNQIRNPATNRCVSKTGAIGKALLSKNTAPARRTSRPARRATAPARRTSPPARRTTAPARRTSPPARRTTAPARRTSPPARRATAPARRTSPPARRATAPARRGNTGRCERQVEPHVSPSIARKYAGRPSPPFPANECCGMVLTGNDGNKWTSTMNAKGICQWKKISKGGARSGGYLGIPYNWQY